MKPVFKIFIIALVSVFLMLSIAAAVMVWVVFTPEKITPIVEKQLAKHLLCETKIERVELTIFSTFPEFGLKIKGLEMRHPQFAAPNDTLLRANSFLATIDIQAFVKQNQVIIRTVSANDLYLNAFVDAAGNANFDITAPSEDTTAFEIPFDLLDVKALRLKNSVIKYNDLSAKMAFELYNLELSSKLNLYNNLLSADIDLRGNDMFFALDTVTYVNRKDIELKTPISFDIKKMIANLSQSKVRLADVGFVMDFDMQMLPDTMQLKLQIVAPKHNVKSVLALIPPAYENVLDGMNLSGNIAFVANLKGVIAENVLPHFILKMNVDDANFAYTGLPLVLQKINGDVLVDLDLNDEKQWFVELPSFEARTQLSKFSGQMRIADLMGDMLINTQFRTNFNLADAKPFIPKDMNVSANGIVSGNGGLHARMSHLTRMAFDKIKLDAKLRLIDFAANYDTLLVNTKEAFVDLKMPSKNKNASFADINIVSPKMYLEQGAANKIDVLGLNTNFMMTDPMKTNDFFTVLGNFDSDNLVADAYAMQANVQKAKGNFSFAMHWTDTTQLPRFTTDMTVGKLKANTDSMHLDVDLAKIEFAYKPEFVGAAKPKMTLLYESEKLMASMGEQLIQSDKIFVDAVITNENGQDNAFLQWVPVGDMRMSNGRIRIPDVPDLIKIPSISLHFMPDVFVVKESRLIIDKSDFSLDGVLSNFRAYSKNEGLLKGDFNFNSNLTDVNHLMKLSSGFGSDENVQANESAENFTFMVPKGVDFTLNANVEKALLSGDTATDVRGKLTIKDGNLLLESILFTASAAKMQLSALYRTPRKNHLFAGFDFHLLDIEIAELLRMIPDVDTIMPMLRSFDGKAEFHMAFETYLDSAYNLKKSTLRGVATVSGQDLVLMDGETFTEIAKALRFNKKTVNKVDSLSAEFTIFRNEVDIYPFLIVMDKYKAVVGGKHSLDMDFDYHISVTESPLPFRLGVDVKGRSGKMSFNPLKQPIYAHMYRPTQRREIDTKQMELRELFRKALVDKVDR